MENILVIDDDRFICDLISKTLTLLGHDVKVAYDGEEAIDLLNKHRFFSIVITDINMPRKDGNSVAKYIRNSSKLKNTPIVAITGLINNVDKELFNIVLEKPFKMKELMNRIGFLMTRTEL